MRSDKSIAAISPALQYWLGEMDIEVTKTDLGKSISKFKDTINLEDGPEKSTKILSQSAEIMNQMDTYVESIEGLVSRYKLSRLGQLRG